MVNDSEQLTKVHIDLPNHWWFKEASLWVKDLGNNEYEIRNIPFCAYSLNFGDVVYATEDAPELKPEIRYVVRRSGNKTIRIFFSNKQEAEINSDNILMSLPSLGRGLSAQMNK